MEEGSRQQIPEVPEREEMASSNSIELQPISSQRKKDQQEKNHHSGCKNTYLVFSLEMLLKESQSPDLKNLIICDISYQLHDCHDIDININLNLDLPTNQSDKNSSDLLSTSSTTQFEIKYQELKKHFGQKIPPPERGKQYDDIMSLHTKMDKKSGVHQVVAGPLLLYLLNHYREKHKGIDKQYAFAVVVLNDRLVISDAAYPEDDDKHSEEFLIEKLCTFFQMYGKNVERVYIYTTNSPCLKSKTENIDPYMFKLLHTLEMLVKESQSPDLLNTSEYGSISGSIDLKNLIICDISYQLHDCHDIDININLNLNLPTNQSDKNSSDLLSTSSTTQFEIKYQELKKRFGQKIPPPERGKQYDDIMSLYSKMDKKLGVHQVVAGPLLLYLLNHYHKEHKGIDKQYAFVVVVMKDDRLVISAPAYPEDDDKHSEESLIEKLCTFFQMYGKNVESVYIYTTNSPCLKSKTENNDPCMFKLLHKSCEWLTEYGFPTTVIFSKFYGFSGSNYFQNADIPDILDEYSNKCKGDSFVLNSKDFDKLKPGDIRTVSDIEHKHREQQLEVVKSALNEIKSETKELCLTNQEYLNHGKKIIQDKMHNQPEKTINTLIGEWNKMVDKSFEEKKPEKITSDFNTAVVHIFEKELKSLFGSNSPLQLYHLVSRSENILN